MSNTKTKGGTLDAPPYEEPAVHVDGAGELGPEDESLMARTKRLAEQNSAGEAKGKNGAKNGATHTQEATTVASREIAVAGQGGGTLDHYRAYTLGPVGLTVDNWITDEELEGLAGSLAQMGTGWKFWLGDYVNAFAKRYNKKIVDVSEYLVGKLMPGYDIHTVQNAASMCSAVPIEGRVEGLSYSHHELASQAPFPTIKARQKMLQKAKDEGWTVKLFREKLFEKKTGQPAAGNKVAVDGVSDAEGEAAAAAGNPSKVKLTAAASQAACDATEQLNTSAKKNLTVDAYVSMVLENIALTVVLTPEAMEAAIKLRDSSRDKEKLSVAGAVSRILVKTWKRQDEMDKQRDADAKVFEAEGKSTGGPPPVE